MSAMLVPLPKDLAILSKIANVFATVFTSLVFALTLQSATLHASKYDAQ